MRLLFAAALPACLSLFVLTPSEGPRVLMESIEGVVSERELEGFSTADPREQGAHLIRFEGLEAGEGLFGFIGEFQLASGDRLQANVLDGEGEELSLELIGGVPLKLSIDSLRSLRFAQRIPSGWSSRLEPAVEGDRLYRKTRAGLDRIDGTLVSFSASGVTLDGALGEKLFEWNEVAAFFVEVFDEELETETDRVPVVVDLTDSSRLTGTLVSLDEHTLKLRFEDADLELPTWAVAELVVDDGQLQFLSELTPTRVEEGSPFGDDLGMQWPYRVDLSVTGEPLRVGGRTHRRGLGVHAPSRLTWKLEGQWKQLRGSVALDDQVKRLPADGSVIFRILLDGEKAWESALIRGGDAAVTIPSVELKDATELTLEVDMATEFHVADRADWIRVLLQ